jgi:hypothetical protein
MAELDVLNTVTTRKFMMTCCRRVETEECSRFLNVAAIIGGFAAASLQKL